MTAIDLGSMTIILSGVNVIGLAIVAFNIGSKHAKLFARIQVLEKDSSLMKVDMEKNTSSIGEIKLQYAVIENTMKNISNILEEIKRSINK